LVDASSGRPTYIVVEAGGLFVGRRYLLPVPHVRFDSRGRVLRVSLSKDVAERYPAFDAAEFRAMNDEQVQHYEQGLRAFFPWHQAQTPEFRTTVSRADAAENSPFDWLAMLGGTFPPSRHERTDRLERSATADRQTPPEGDNR
jgi:hypothetical protein